MTTVENARQGLNITQAANTLGVHPQTIRLWMKRYDEDPEDPQGLPYTRFGKQIIRISEEDLTAKRNPSRG